MSKEWIQRDFPLTRWQSSEEEGLDKLPEFVIQFLHQRGFSSAKEARDFLFSQLSNLKDPMTMLHMKPAVQRLIEAFQSSEKICIYADFDLDGTSGMVLLSEGLKNLGYKNLVLYQPKRLSEGYGFHASAVDELAGQGVTLIVTVDVGITAHAACEKAQSLGVDVIITDHHLPTETLPKAKWIINPNQKECTSELGYLCGAGVAFYLVRALKRAFYENPLLEKKDCDLRELLDLFVIATITDMVPLVGDNRILLKHGLLQLEKTKRPGLRALLKALDLSGRSLSSQDVGIKMAPKINALSRMESRWLPRDLYLLENETDAQTFIQEVLSTNSDRVDKQTYAQEIATHYLKENPPQDFIFIVSEKFHRGVVGLVATKLAQEFNLPAFVGSLSEEESVVVGSSRLPPGSDWHLVEALSFAKNELSRFGGHAAAAGFEFHHPRQEKIANLLREYFLQSKKTESIRKTYFDQHLFVEEVNPTLMKWLEFIGPFGVNFEFPLFHMGPMWVSSLKELKGGHLKLSFKDKSSISSATLECIYFSPPAEMKKQISSNSEVEILVELQWNYFAGRKTIQGMVRELRILKSERVNNEVSI